MACVSANCNTWALTSLWCLKYENWRELTIRAVTMNNLMKWNCDHNTVHSDLMSGIDWCVCCVYGDCFDFLCISNGQVLKRLLDVRQQKSSSQNSTNWHSWTADWITSISFTHETVKWKHQFNIRAECSFFKYKKNF